MNHNSTSEAQTLKASNFISSYSIGRGRGRRRERVYRGNQDGGNKEGNGIFRANDYDKGIGSDFDRSKVECYCFHKFGLCRSECYTRQHDENE